MSDGSVILNQNQTAGSNIAVWVDATQRCHQEVVLQTQLGSNDPVSISNNNPLPIWGPNASLTPAINTNPIKIAGAYNTSPPAVTNGQMVDLQTDASGNLKVNIAAGAAAGGTSIQDGTAFTRGTTPETPAAGVVSTNNPALTAGNAGALSLDTLGNLRVLPYGTLIDAGTFTRGTNFELPVGAAVDSTAPTLTAGKAAALSLDTAGNLRVNVVTGGGAGGTSLADGSTFTRNTTLETPVGGAVDSSSPTLTAGKLAALSLDTAGNLRVNLVAGGIASGSAGSPSTNVVTMQGITGMTPLAIQVTPGSAPGSSRSRVAAAASTNANNLKTSAGAVLAYGLYNNTASPRYFRFFDKASAPTPGTDTPAWTIIIPASGGANIDLGGSGGIPFNTGIGYDITAGNATDGDTTACAANDVHGFVLWK